MTAKTPNAREEQLLDKIDRLVTSKQRTDPREGGFYFESTPQNQKDFVNVATEVAALIREQGVARTCDALLSVGRALKNAPEMVWKDGIKLGYVLYRAVQATKTAHNYVAADNPFRNMKL